MAISVPTGEEVVDPKSIFYPPGGLLIWGLVLLELFTFSAVLIALVVSSKSDPQAFHESRLLLRPIIGVINTVFLLTSGYFMATSLECFKKNDATRTRRYLLLTVLGGGLFLVLKGFEYHDKLSHGLTLGHNTFFTYYWLLTSFHVIHVLVGIVILLCMFFTLKSPSKTLKLEDFDAGAVFWHMCDLIWLILFPVLYLLL